MVPQMMEFLKQVRSKSDDRMSLVRSFFIRFQASGELELVGMRRFYEKFIDYKFSIYKYCLIGHLVSSRRIQKICRGFM